MKKKYLLAPGPVQAPPEVLLTMAKPLIHHRTPEFESLFADVQKKLRALFMTTAPVITFASSGTGAMEAAIVNTHSAGDEVLVVNIGKFGERLGKISEAYGLKVHYHTVEWGEAARPADIEKILQEKPQIRSVMLQYSETSTASMNDVQAIAAIVAKTEALLIVDAITALGVTAIPVEDWKIDLLIGGSQKSLMLPPGLSFLWLSARAWERSKSARLPRFYFDVNKERKALEDNTTAWTPAINLIDALHTALGMMEEYGYDKLYERNIRLMKALHAGFEKLGMKIFSKAPSVSVTAALVPAGIDGKKLVAELKNIHGVTIAGGQDHLTGKIIRVGTLGYVDASDIVVFFASLEAVLHQHGHQFDWGTGVGAAQAVLYA